MTREDINRIYSEYLNDCENMQEMEKVFVMATKALEQEPTQIDEIPKDYIYDTETRDCLVYRHKYTGDEIHIIKPIPVYTLKQDSTLDKPHIKGDYYDGFKNGKEH